MSKYDYLKQYQAPHDHVVETWRENSFIQASSESILTVEKNLSMAFPSELKEFWLEVGGGNLTTPKNSPEDYESYYINNFLFPEEIEQIIVNGSSSGLITEEALEYIDAEEIPFFEICDHSSFLYIRPNSDKPNAVYDLGGEVIENSLETFIWKLYHISPTYYLNK